MLTSNKNLAANIIKARDLYCAKVLPIDDYLVSLAQVQNEYQLSKYVMVMPEVIMKQQELLREASEALRLAHVVCFNRHAETTEIIQHTLYKINYLLEGTDDE